MDLQDFPSLYVRLLSLLITFGYCLSPPDFPLLCIEIKWITLSRSEHLSIQFWVGLCSMLSIVCCSPIDGLLSSVTKWSQHLAKIRASLWLLFCCQSLAVILSGLLLGPAQLFCFGKNSAIIRVCKYLEFSHFCKPSFIFEFFCISLSEVAYMIYIWPVQI